MAISWDGIKRLGLPLKKQPKVSGDGPATKCEACNEMLIKKTLDDNLGVCQLCGYYHRLPARRRAEITLDTGSFEERYANLISGNPLNFTARTSYPEKLNRYWRATGEASAFLAGTGTITGRRVVFGASDGFFCQGSMGSVLGEKFTRLAEDALNEKMPLVVVSSTGAGARMEEGLISLMQMAKTSAALGRLHEAGIPFISVCTKFTMAGVWASWAALGDVIIAEPKALIGFTGARVIKETIKKELPEGFQSSEFLLEHGQVDCIVERKDMRATIGSMLDYLCGAPVVNEDQAKESA